MTDQPIEPSILDAIDQGCGQRGKTNPQEWSRHRAQVLTAAYQGVTQFRIAGKLGLSQVQVRTLVAEACAAVLQGGAVSDVADTVCAARWQSWCETGDTTACDRVRRG